MGARASRHYCPSKTQQYLRSYFPPERVKKALAGKGEFIGTVLAALLGTITPTVTN